MLISTAPHLCVGKMRNRRYTLRKGPLVIYANNNGIAKAFRNLPGVECISVDSLNLLQVRMRWRQQQQPQYFLSGVWAGALSVGRCCNVCVMWEGLG